MITLHGYTCHWQDNRTLITSPSGQSFVIEGDKVREGSFRVGDAPWRHLPVTEAIRDAYTSMPWACPELRGPALDLLAYARARVMIRQYEKWTVNTVTQWTLDHMSGEQKETLFKGQTLTGRKTA